MASTNEKAKDELKLFQQYFEGIREKFKTGDSTEVTHRTVIENFIKSLNSDYDVIQEPKRGRKLGAPDFKALRKKVIAGYIETKDLDKNLDLEVNSDQIKKYKESINNLILTNYTRFILIRNNEKIFDIDLFRTSDLDNSKFHIEETKSKEFVKMFETFFDYNHPTIKSAKELAEMLSRKAKLLKELAKEQLEHDLTALNNQTDTSSSQLSSVHDFYEGMKELIHDIRVDDCADSYAQTITYGLFLARRFSKGPITRDTAATNIPKSIGLIRRIFTNIGGDLLPSNVSWIVDEIIGILNAADIDELIKETDEKGKKVDPLIYFYENFLSSYDPQKKKKMGVYYTPRPVVSFIVKSVNELLKDAFDKAHGFGDDDVTVLDPAVGTGTFLWLIYLRTIVDLKEKGMRGLIQKKIENHVLKDFHGFEILITPYIIAHLKLAMVLAQWGYKFGENERAQVYLTNTLEPQELHGLMPFLKELSQESIKANEIKTKKPILVVVGNPPYSVSSSNKSEWITNLMKDYKKDLNERNIQPLDDDYIKFIRFAQWKIDKNGEGVLGYITNNSYLDGIIHRQMRKELLKTFDRVFIVNLHGDSRKGENSPDGKPDENVFDIQQGVAIAIFVKNNVFKEKKMYYTDLYGTRDYKYEWLDKNTVKSVKWQEIDTPEPYYFFKKLDVSASATVAYQKLISLRDIFDESTIGVVSGDDERFTSFEKTNSTPDRYAYRPFDIRYIDIHNKELQRARLKVMKNFEKQNLGLVCSKQSRNNPTHAFVTDCFMCKHFISDASYVMPLYRYSLNGDKMTNLKKEFMDFINNYYPHKQITPEQIMYYIYAALYSSKYRQSFEGFLKIDFPRIPFPKDHELFLKVYEIGKELVELHLMKSKISTTSKFDETGDNVVKFVKHDNHKIFINEKQYFGNASEDVWNFYIGAYQVLDKYLKNRKGRELSSKEIEHVLQVVEVIKETLKLMKEIDKIKFF